MDHESESVLVKLTRMEGKLDMSCLRHDQHDQRFVTIDQRLHAHGNRIGVLEAKNHLSDGKAEGIATSAKILYALGGMVPVGVVLAILKAANLL